ncbi:MAG: hypothetical protein ACLPKI_28025 [Streptosporangiaceae bacterium]
MGMGTVHKLTTMAAGMSLGAGITAYLATLAGAEQAGTRALAS